MPDRGEGQQGEGQRPYVPQRQNRGADGEQDRLCQRLTDQEGADVAAANTPPVEDERLAGSEPERPGVTAPPPSPASCESVEVARGTGKPMTAASTTKRTPRRVTSASIVPMAAMWCQNGRAKNASAACPFLVSTTTVATRTPARLSATKSRWIKSAMPPQRTT